MAVVAFGSNEHHQCDMPTLPFGCRCLALAAGGRHTVLLYGRGDVQSAGANDRGQRDLPKLPASVRFVAVAAGEEHSVFLRSDGRASAAGSPADGRCVVPDLPLGLRYVAAAAGKSHTVLLRSCGEAVAFGSNSHGQCDAPALPAGLRYVAVAAGHDHTLLLRSDGRLVGFGADSEGQCRVPPLPPASFRLDAVDAYEKEATADARHGSQGAAATADGYPVVAEGHAVGRAIDGGGGSPAATAGGLPANFENRACNSPVNIDDEGAAAATGDLPEDTGGLAFQPVIDSDDDDDNDCAATATGDLPGGTGGLAFNPVIDDDDGGAPADTDGPASGPVVDGDDDHAAAATGGIAADSEDLAFNPVIDSDDEGDEEHLLEQKRVPVMTGGSSAIDPESSLADPGGLAATVEVYDPLFEESLDDEFGADDDPDVNQLPLADQQRGAGRQRMSLNVLSYNICGEAQCGCSKAQLEAFQRQKSAAMAVDAAKAGEMARENIWFNVFQAEFANSIDVITLIEVGRELETRLREDPFVQAEFAVFISDPRNSKLRGMATLFRKRSFQAAQFRKVDEFDNSMRSRKGSRLVQVFLIDERLLYISGHAPHREDYVQRSVNNLNRPLTPGEIVGRAAARLSAKEGCEVQDFVYVGDFNEDILRPTSSGRQQHRVYMSQARHATGAPPSTRGWSSSVLPWKAQHGSSGRWVHAPDARTSPEDYGWRIDWMWTSLPRAQIKFRGYAGDPFGGRGRRYRNPSSDHLGISCNVSF